MENKECKKILFLSFYYKPDLCAGSFRASALVEAFQTQEGFKNVEIDVFTTMPNRYNTFKIEAPLFEDKYPIQIYRTQIGSHESGFIDQARSFFHFFFAALRFTRGKKYDLVLSTSSRLFTAFLGAVIAVRLRTYLYLDIRDIFTDTMNDVLKNPVLRFFTRPVFLLVENFTFRRANHINLVSEGFRNYFETRYKKSYTFFSNGIDKEFINHDFRKTENNDTKIITYAGNIGQGQGLHEIIPGSAKLLEGKFHFKIIGDGGAKKDLVDAIKILNLTNVEILPPVDRENLLQHYRESDYLMLHLNDYQAFEKVLPSKIFEYGATQKGIIAGIKGYSAEFVRENLPDAILFNPTDVKAFTDKMIAESDTVKPIINRQAFINKFNRQIIILEMTSHILSKIKKTT